MSYNIVIDPVENGSSLLFRNTINNNFTNVKTGVDNFKSEYDDKISDIENTLDKKVTIWVQKNTPSDPQNNDLWFVSDDYEDKKSGEWYKYYNAVWTKISNTELEELGDTLTASVSSLSLKLNSYLKTKDEVEYIDGSKVIDISGDSMTFTQEKLKTMIKWDNFEDATQTKIAAYENPKYISTLKASESTSASLIEAKTGYIKIGSSYILSSKPTSTEGYEEGALVFVVG